MGKSKLPSIINHCKNYAKNILKGLDNTNIDTRVFPVKSEVPKDVVSLLDNMSILEPDFYFIRSINDESPLAYILLYKFHCDVKDVNRIPDMSICSNSLTIYFTEYDVEHEVYYYAQMLFKELDGLRYSLIHNTCMYNYSLTSDVQQVLMLTLKHSHDVEYDYSFEEIDC